MFSSDKTVISKVPSNEKEALKSNLMGLFEKKRMRNFFIFIDKFVKEDPKTWDKLDMNNATIA
jgi:Rab GDP dissociation inhibitor